MCKNKKVGTTSHSLLRTLLLRGQAFLSALLIIAGFVVPPLGQIDPSVLTAVGLLLAFRVVDTIPELARRGTDVTLQHGQTSVTVNNPDPKNEN